MLKVLKVFYSDTTFTFAIFMGMKAFLTILAYRSKYLLPSVYTSDISQNFKVLQSGITEGMEIAINAANPVPFISINVISPGITWDWITVLISLFSLFVAYGFYKVRKVNEYPNYGYRY
ncbi:hypothetical protein [Methanococcoides burtonii]|uniref:Uncharacterized protein n=1 Tax=Methanococcoides burtonii (strain DSM 6242 / NBRC 107633 / OCM 468 / ACE-M) TaxID=259564 RepID=Q12V40_METBU|nr:hypothetical protein [Methanococcoides burtonii]ABE52686.1 Hypothetical protein Mbur_1798 [Methanococcoides burtonii DSM 6242]